MTIMDLVYGTGAFVLIAIGFSVAAMLAVMMFDGVIDLIDLIQGRAEERRRHEARMAAIRARGAETRCLVKR